MFVDIGYSQSACYKAVRNLIFQKTVPAMCYFLMKFVKSVTVTVKMKLSVQTCQKSHRLDY